MVDIINVSKIYETEPVSGPPQGKFLDAAAETKTQLTPRTLLVLLKKIEQDVGRTPSEVRWGPREIDLDILLFGDLVIDEPDLKVPHPLLHLRSFILEPLCEIAPEVIHPIFKKSIAELFSDFLRSAKAEKSDAK